MAIGIFDIINVTHLHGRSCMQSFQYLKALEVVPLYKVFPNCPSRILRGCFLFLAGAKWHLWNHKCYTNTLKKLQVKVPFPMNIKNVTSLRCLQIVWFRNVPHVHRRSYIPNLKSLCPLQVVPLQCVSKSSSKESKRTSVVPDWCQIGSLTSRMF